MDLGEADNLGNLPSKNPIPELRERIENVRNSPLKVKTKPVLNGEEIAQALGIAPGPIIGEAIRYLMDKQDDWASRGKELTKDDAAKMVVQKFGESLC